MLNSSKSGRSHCNSQLIAIKSWFTLWKQWRSHLEFTASRLKAWKKERSFVPTSPLSKLSACQECLLACPLNTSWPLVYQHPLFDSPSLSNERRSHGMTQTVNESNSQLTETAISFFCPLHAHAAGSAGVGARIRQPFTSWPPDTSLLGLHTEWEVSSHQ